MNNEPLYNKTVEILVQAYFNDTLQHGSCTACAVGNLCCGRASWSEVFMTSMGEQDIYPYKYEGYAKRLIDATGYTWQELAKIEYAFETVPESDNVDERMFCGLMAVIEVLDQIHGNTDQAVTTKTKSLFQKA